MKHEVFWEEGWLSVETTLLNIISAKYEDKQLKIKPD
jgi:hypothetical protein